MTFINLKNLVDVQPGTLLKARGCEGSFALVLEPPTLNTTQTNSDTSFHLNCNCWHISEKSLYGTKRQPTDLPKPDFLTIKMHFFPHQGLSLATCVGWEIYDGEDINHGT